MVCASTNLVTFIYILFKLDFRLLERSELSSLRACLGRHEVVPYDRDCCNSILDNSLEWWSALVSLIVDLSMALLILSIDLWVSSWSLVSEQESGELGRE